MNDRNVSWTTDIDVTKSFGSNILTGQIYFYNDFDIEYSIRKSIMYHNLNKNEIVIFDINNVKNIEILDYM